MALTQPLKNRELFMKDLEKFYDVLVVGAGPVGLMAANLLGLYGVKTLLIEKEAKMYTYPRAVSADDETLRNFQLIGLSQSEINSLFIPAKIEYFSEKAYRCFEPDMRFNPFGHPLLSNFFQPDLEKKLREKLNAHTSLSFISPCEYLSHKNQEKFIEAKLLYNGKEEPIYCNYLLACDGGKSQIRKSLDINFLGDSRGRSTLVVDVKDSEEMRSIIEKYSQEPKHIKIGTIRLPHNLRRFEVVYEEGPKESRPATIEETQELLAPFSSSIELNIIRSRFYVRAYRIAEKFYQGNIFLLGDAAHLVPPYGGQGMCSGIRDAVNLCWKIALFSKFGYCTNFAETYDQERRDHILATMDFIKKLEAMHASEIEQKKPEKIAEDKYRNMKASPKHPRGFQFDTPYAGELFPQPTVKLPNGKINLLDDFFGIAFVMIGINCNASEFLSKGGRDFWESLGCNFLTVKRESEQLYLLDKDGHVLGSIEEKIPIFLDPNIEILLLRPDRFIFASVKKDELEAFTLKFTRA